MDDPEESNSPYPPFHFRFPGPPPMALDENEFRRGFAESEYVEWKAGISADRIQAAVVAFSNADGGIIQIGVRDDGTIAGKALDDNTGMRLTEIVSGVRNPGRFSLHELVVGVKAITIVAVEKRHEGFAQLPNGHVLVRQSKSNRGLFGQDLATFVNSRLLTRFEATSTGLLLDQADRDLLAALADALGWSNEEEWSDRLVERGLATRQPRDKIELTVAGALFLVPDAASILSKAYVELFRYPDPGSTVYDKRTEIHGAVNDQVRNATQLVLDELGVDQVILGTFRHELPRLPPVVVREAIANAVAHRSYENNTTAVRISIYPDAVVVRSPGSFPEPVTEQNIRDTNSPRNPATLRVLRQMGLAEDAGMGVDRMQDEMRAEMLQPPRFLGSDIAVEVTLPITGTVAPREKAWVREVEDRGEIQPQDRIVLVHAARGEVLTNAGVREILNIDSVEARQILQRLRDVGFLRQSGERGGSQYSLAEGLNPPAGLRLTRTELQKLVVDLAQSGPVTNGSIREATGLGRDEVKQLLRDLVDDGRLVLMGERRGAYYVLPGSEESSQLPLRVTD